MTPHWKDDAVVRAMVDGAIVSPKRSETQNIAGADAVYSLTEPHLFRLLDAVAALSERGAGTAGDEGWLRIAEKECDSLEVLVTRELDKESPSRLRIICRVAYIAQMIRQYLHCRQQRYERGGVE